jgi:hypothetical protein
MPQPKPLDPSIEMKQIPGHSEYWISKDGTIVERRSTASVHWPHTLRSVLKARFQPVKGKDFPNGYMYVSLLSKDNKPNKVYGVGVHRLVCAAWNGPTDIPNAWVNHEDGNKLNNLHTNLKWETISYNIQHSVDTGLRPIRKGPDHWRFGITLEQGSKDLMRAAKEKHAKYVFHTPKGDFWSQRLAAQANGVADRTISNWCKAGKYGFSISLK